MDGAELYRSIGVTPVINAVGSVTLLGGSTPDARVTAAMDAAAQSYAPMDELQLKAGQAIAQLVGAPAAMVTSGCAGAMVLAAAAAMTDNDPRKIIQLPDTTGLRSEILIQANQRYHYDRCWEMSGAKLVEYEPTEEALRAAISHRTAACVVRPEEAFPGSLPLPLIAAVAHSLGVSVMVDAAEQCYPLSNMTRFVEAGADCQCIAAKYLGSAQSTGLAIGTETFITSMFRNSFIGFERPDSSFGAGVGEYRQGLDPADDQWFVRGVGRPSKIDRQEIMGAYMAVKVWTEMDHVARIASFRDRSQTIADALTGVPGVISAVVDPKTEQHDPHGVTIEIDRDVLPVDELIRRLKSGEPALWTRRPLGSPPGAHLLKVALFGLHQGQEAVVVDLITHALTAAAAELEVAADAVARL